MSWEIWVNSRNTKVILHKTTKKQLKNVYLQIYSHYSILYRIGQGVVLVNVQRAIISIIGVDKVGIIYSVSKLLAEANINILDISQTILRDIFTMIMIVDISNSTVEFNILKENLNSLGEKMGLKIDIQKEDIFRAMHRL